MKLQIVYPPKAFEPSTPHYHNGWLDEIDGIRHVGLNVATTPSPDADRLLLRSFIIDKEENFPSDGRYISHWDDYHKTQAMSCYLPLIEDLTIPSFICNKLDSDTVEQIKRRGWQRAFVRSDVKSLKYMFPESHTEEQLPIWPDVSMDRLAKVYGKYREHMQPPYIIRKVMPKEVMRQEERYWIMNGHAYHHNGIIPPVVKEAVDRLKSLHSPYYVIDATPSMVVEVNPGVSSDAYPENLPELFPLWVKKEFLNKTIVELNNNK